jgi:hypothetical protein
MTLVLTLFFGFHCKHVINTNELARNCVDQVIKLCVSMSYLKNFPGLYPQTS